MHRLLSADRCAVPASRGTGALPQLPAAAPTPACVARRTDTGRPDQNGTIEGLCPRFPPRSTADGTAGFHHRRWLPSRKPRRNRGLPLFGVCVIFHARGYGLSRFVGRCFFPAGPFPLVRRIHLLPFRQAPFFRRILSPLVARLYDGLALRVSSVPGLRYGTEMTTK